jgi:hypothetical protein
MYYFGTMVVSASDPKDIFKEQITMFIVQITGLIFVGLVE